VWRKLLRPDVLFALAGAQALLPYLLWAFGIQVARYPHDLNYFPMLYWGFGLVLFYFGGLCVRRRPAEIGFTLAPDRTRIMVLCFVLLGLLAIQLALIVQLYGTLPLLSFFNKDRALDVSAATRIQDQSGMGQIGMLYLTLFVGNGLLLLLCLINLEPGDRRKTYLLLMFMMPLMFAAGIYNGKREAAVCMFVYVIAGVTLYTNRPAAALRSLLPVLRNKTINMAALALLLYALVAFFGFMSGFRNQGRYQVSGIEEGFAYYEYSLLNFDAQCGSSGLLPDHFSLLFPFKQLIPYKMVENVEWPEPPPRLERTAPAGFYELVQWSWGLPGVILFSFLVGMLSMWLYQRALDDVAYLLVYCQFVVALAFAHSFNFFLILVNIVAPCVAFLCIRWFLGRRAEGPVYYEVESEQDEDDGEWQFPGTSAIT
jgi:hypothetical protein